MGNRHSYKQVALKIRHHTLMVQVRRKLRALDYKGIQTTGYTDSYGARLVEHDLIVYNTFIMVRALGHKPTYIEGYLLETDPRYIMQCGASDISALVERLTVAKARHLLPRTVHWSTVGNDDD